MKTAEDPLFAGSPRDGQHIMSRLIDAVAVEARKARSSGAVVASVA